MRVLLVEDDPMIGQAVENALKDASYAVDWVTNGKTALTTLSCQNYELILLDLGLPGSDGMTVLKTIRRHHNSTSVIIITAQDQVESRIEGLDNGADDYLLKPFFMKKLLARMRAVSRRKNGSATPLLGTEYVTLDPTQHEAQVENQPSVLLSNKEFAVLQALLLRPGAILSRSELENRVYGWGEEVESNAVEYLIHTLRKKLGSDVIKNIRGVGWMVSKSKPNTQ